MPATAAISSFPFFRAVVGEEHSEAVGGRPKNSPEASCLLLLLLHLLPPPSYLFFLLLHPLREKEVRIEFADRALVKWSRARVVSGLLPVVEQAWGMVVRSLDRR